MTKAAALLPVLLAACVDPSYPTVDDSPSTPVASVAQNRVADQAIVVATGGVEAIAIPDVASIGWSGDATAGFSVEPFDADGWPNTQKPEYWIRATAAGAGSFVIHTNHGIASGNLEAADVARVALVPADYELDGRSPFALSTERPLVAAALFDATDRRLVDATLVLGATGATQLAWDRATLTAAPGSHTLRVSADSFAGRDLTVDIVAAANARTETVVSGNRSCVHTYVGNVEIAAATAIATNGQTIDPHATNCVIGR